MLFCIIGGQAAKACPIRIDDADLIISRDFEYLAGLGDLPGRLPPRDGWYNSLIIRFP